MQKKDNKYSGPRKGKTSTYSKINKSNSELNSERKPINRKPSVNTRIEKSEEDEKVRLNKFIASTGLCSRREADSYIKSGKIKVNGELITELGSKISKNDKVSLNNKILQNEKHVYILLNKPKGFVTSTKDPKHDKLVMQLVSNCCPERIFPVGRLDMDTLGVLLLTNDGELAQQLTHPKYNKKKIYHVFLDKNVTKNDINKIAIGFELEDGFINADGISYADSSDKSQVGIEIHSGKNRIVRRIFEHLGYKVKKLDRVHFAGLTKKGLQRGRWRFLSEKEIGMLKMRSYK